MVPTDGTEVHELLPRVVRVLASWSGDLRAADEMAGQCLARALAIPPVLRPHDLVSWSVEQGRLALAHRDASGPGVDLQGGLDPDGSRSGLDDRLALLFVVCDPALRPDDQVVLALRLACGLDEAEVAVHLGLERRSAATALRRAHDALALALPRFVVPRREERNRRLAAVLDCVAAMFTVAHRTSPEPPDALEDLGPQALGIADALVDIHPGDSEVRGLRAVVLLGLARRPGRVDDEGTALTLDQVDRDRWDHRMLEIGLDDTVFAMQGHGRFALEAAIARLHTTATGVATTDWARVVQLYEVLRQVWASPAVEVAELAARTQLVLHRFPGTSVEAAGVLDAVEHRLVQLLGDAPTLARRDAAFALADLRWRTGREAEAQATYRQLLAHVTSPPVRAFCERRLRAGG